MENQFKSLIGAVVLAASAGYPVHAMAAGSPVGQWTCYAAATQSTPEFQERIAVYGNGTWQMEEAIAPMRNQVGTMVRARGSYQQTGADSLSMIYSQVSMSADGVNWMPGPLPGSAVPAQMQGESLNVGGIACHRSG